jgi:hypothetical protein
MCTRGIITLYDILHESNSKSNFHTQETMFFDSVQLGP